MAKSDLLDAESAVRLYLMYLDNPDTLIDSAAIERAEHAVATAKDPIEKLKAISALERARAIDGKSYEAGFIRFAAEWADAQGVTPSAFESMGVRPDVLAAAGVAGAAPANGRSATGRRARGASAPRVRAKAVNAETIRDHVLRVGGSFTLAQLMEEAGGSPATVKKAIQELIEAGRVENLGADPSHSGKGRAPYRYQTLGA